MRVKICGLTQVQQAIDIVQQGANSIGFICVKRSPRYLNPQQIQQIILALPSPVDKVGVFAGSSLAEISSIVKQTGLTSVQLHGNESPDFCTNLRQALPPGIEIIKAFRIQVAASLQETNAYLDRVDTLLLDAYHPQMLGGTGQTIDWQDLAQFKPSLPWLLAGGLTPSNIKDALTLLQPDGIDLSSGVERSPGDKDLDKVQQLFQQLAALK